MRRVTCEEPGRGLGLTRRTFAGLAAGGLAAGGLLVPAAPVLAAPASVTFRVFRKGDEIGMHSVTITPAAGRLDVDVKIELAVKLAMITVFYYRQTARDTWRDGKLVAGRYRTDDDGKVTELALDAADGRLKIDGAAGRTEAPLGTMTDLAFWNESIVHAPQLVDSQTGALGTMQTDAKEVERITVRGREVGATRYTVSGSYGRGGKVWYADGQWVKAAFVTRGEALDYELV